MNRSGALFAAVLLLGSTPPATGIVAGTVRDQRGVAVDGARVTLYASGTGVASTATAADGTFAVANVTADSVRVGCQFCEPARVSIGPDGIVVVIVHRFDALANEGPSDADLASLPYGNVESAMSLTPFVVLKQSRFSYPGSELLDRRVYGAGGLVLINDVPAYDIAGNISPFDTIPQHDYSNVEVARTDDEYLYGDVANGGTFYVRTTGGPSSAFGGNDGALRVTSSSDVIGSSGEYSSGVNGDRRERIDASAPFALPGFAATASVGAGRGDETPPDSAPLTTAFSSARLSLQRTSGADISASLTADRGTYDYAAYQFPLTNTWSDVEARASIRSHAVLAPFASLVFRRSSADETLGQTRAVAGATLHEAHFDALAAFGTENGAYGALGDVAGTPFNATDGVISATWTPSSLVSLEASANRGYTLPAFSAVYDGNAPIGTNVTPPLSIEQNHTVETTLSLNDGRRMRIGLTALNFGAGSDERSGSTGVSLAWQAAPALSLRAWVLRVADTESGAAAIGSVWLTYDTGHVRVDAIVRRDLRDLQPDQHLDASVSGWITRKLAWFIGTERRNGVRATDAGLRW